MPDYQRMYYRLFNAATDVLEALAEQDYGRAKKLLVEGQQASEEIYLNTDCSNKEDTPLLTVL